MWHWGQLMVEQPLGLLTLLLIPLVVLLHWLQQERQERTVPGLYLWQRLSRRLPHRSFWRQLLTDPLFWLQATTAILFAVLLAKPDWQAVQAQPWEWIVVIDRSASLAASFDGTISRDQALRHELESLWAETPSQVRWTLVSAGPSAELVARDLDLDTPDGRAALERLPPPGGEADWEAAGRLVTAISSARTAAVVVLTDESLTQSELSRFFPQLYRLITLVPASQQIVANLGIVDLEVQPVGDSLTRYQVLGVVMNGGQAAADFTLHWYNDGRLLATDRGRIDPGEGAKLVRQVALLPGTSLKLELVTDGPDLLAADNEAFAVTLPLRNVQVLLYAPGESAVARALLAAPRLALAQRTAADETLAFSGKDWSQYDLVVFDRVPPPVRPPLPTVTVGLAPGAATALLTPLETAALNQPNGQAAGQAAVDYDHPLSRYVRWDEIRLAPARTGSTTSAWSPWPVLPGALPLWQVREGALVQVAAGLPPRVIVAFDLYDSDWPQRVSFPVWVKNLLDWALPWVTRPIGPVLRPGEALPDWFLGATGIHPGAETEDPGWEIVTPDGSVQPLPPDLPLAAYRLPPDAPPGPYWLRRQGGKVLAGWSVSLLAEQETQLLVPTPDPTAMASNAAKGGNQLQSGQLQVNGPSQAGSQLPVDIQSEVPEARTSRSNRPLLEVLGILLLILALAAELAVAFWESRPVARPRVGAKGGTPSR